MKSIIYILLFVAAVPSMAQCPAPATYVKVAGKKGEYSVNSQSRSGSIKNGETYEMAFIAQKGFDYRLTTQALETNGTLNYEIYELVVEKASDGTYKKNKKVLASSSSNGAKPLEFSTDKSRKIFVAVTLSGGDPKEPSCVGVLLEDKKSVKLGF